MANILLKRSAVAGKVPETSSLNLGEMAINTADAKIYIRQISASVDAIVPVAMMSGILNTGSFNISGSVHVTGSLGVSNYYYGSGKYLTDITSSYVGIGSGSYWTSSDGNISRESNVQITGSLFADNMTGSLFGTSSWAISSSYAMSAGYIPYVIRANVAFVVRGTLPNFTSPPILIPDTTANAYEVRGKTVSGSLNVDINKNGSAFVVGLPLSSSSWTILACSESLAANDAINIFVYNTNAAQDLSMNIFISKSIL